MNYQDLLSDPEVVSAFELLHSKGVGAIDYAAWRACFVGAANVVERSAKFGHEPPQCGYFVPGAGVCVGVVHGEFMPHTFASEDGAA